MGYGERNPLFPPLNSSASPYDLNARYGKKGPPCGLETSVHFTQTCDEDAPQLITHVETAPAPTPDEKALCKVHTDLAEKNLLPNQHLVDAGYIDATTLMESQASYGVDLVGPTLKNYWY